MKRALAAVCALLCLLPLSGCHSHRPLKLPEVISLQKEIQEMPVVNDIYNNYCPVNYSRGLVFYIACGDLTREEALTIARKVRELFIQEEFMDTFLTTVGSGDSEYYRACNRCPAMWRWSFTAIRTRVCLGKGLCISFGRISLPTMI